MSYSNLDPSSVLRDTHIEAEHALRVAVTGTVTTTSTAAGLDSVAAPQYIAAASIPAYGSAYLQLIASTSADIKQLHIFDTTGSFLVIGVGGVGVEVEEIIVGPGNDQPISVNIVSGSRISIKSREGSAPVAGNVAINFLG
jgi:hypothetical protein